MAKGVQTPIATTNGYGPDRLEVVQWVQRHLHDVGIEAARQGQEYGASMATTCLGQYEAMALGPLRIPWDPETVRYGMEAPDQPRNSGHGDTPQRPAMLKAARRPRDLEARPQRIDAMQRDVVAQQY